MGRQSPCPGRMVLYAAGFNACGQLAFDADAAAQDEPHDLCSFAPVLDGDAIARPVARLSYTLARRNGRLCMAGVGPEDEPVREAGYLAAEAANGQVLAVRRDEAPPPDAAAGPPGERLVKYASLAALAAGEAAQQSWTPSAGPVTAVAAFDAGFAVLHRDGTVATLGDARFEDCLGRDVTQESPASEPSIVSDLAGLGDPVRHVSASGYNLAALTEGGAVHVWGMVPPHGLPRRRGAFAAISRVPNYVPVGDDKDVQDVAVGDSHALALTTDGSVYVVGDNTNGQLGLGKSAGCHLQSWTDISFQPPSGQRVVAVAAGPLSSFILTAAVEV